MICLVLISILISIYVALGGRVKSDRLLDFALQFKARIQYLNLFTIDHCKFISHRNHNVIRDNIHSAQS